jgi:hypothetical protein
MGLDHVRSEIEHMRIQVGRQRKEILQLQRAGNPPLRLNSSLEGCTPRSMTFVPSGSGSRESRALQRRGACLAAGVGDGSTAPMVRREGG